MAVLELVLVEVFPLQTLLILVVRAARALARQPELLAVQAARPELRVLRALRLLLEICSGKVVVAVVQVMQAQAAQAAQAVVVLVEAAVAQHAVHTPLALVVSAVMAGH